MPLSLIEEKYYDRHEVEALCDHVKMRIHKAIDSDQTIALTAEALKDMLDGTKMPNLSDVRKLLDTISSKSAENYLALQNIRKKIDEEILKVEDV
jgi:hypothetical protein